MSKETCKACALEAYEPPDMDAFCPPALNHTCKEKGPKTKKELLDAIHAAAVGVHFGFSAAMGGGNYHAKEELEGLIKRLAAYKIPGKGIMGLAKDSLHRFWNADRTERAYKA